MDITLVRFGEFMAGVLLLSLAIFTGLMAHYRNTVIPSSRVLYALAFVAILESLNRFIVLLVVFNEATVIAYNGLILTLIILWGIWGWRNGN